MSTNLKGTNLEITPEISEYLNKRLESVRKFLPDGAEALMIDIELGKTTNHHNAGDIFRAEINVHFGGKNFRAVSEQTSLYGAIDDMKDEVTRELGSYKERKVSLVRRGGQKIKNLLRGLPWRKR